MTQEEKAKAYDEALTIAKRIISKNCSEVEKLCLKSIFPELAESESEDERIRKKIIENVRLSGGYTDEEIDEMISWLERQKEQKPAEWEDYKDKVNIPYCSSEPEWSENDEKILGELFGYEGGTESPLVKITFTIPKEHFNRLMPIKQGDVFGIENLTNKEGIR